MSANKYYPRPCDVLGVITAPGESRPFDGTEQDWQAFVEVCAQRDAAEENHARLLSRVRELEGDKKLWEWAATHPEDTFGAFCAWWATAGTGGRETRFEFRNIVKMGRDSARKEAP